jgi:hypothetical protein
MEVDKTLASRRTHRSPMLAHETSPVLGASVVGMTNGASPRGMPQAELFADWRPRNLHDSKIRRPALPGGPAMPAAGWQFHRGRPKQGNEDKSPPMAVSLKVG